MAIWQFRLDLIPEKAIRSKYGTLPITIPADMAENFHWWADVQPPAGFEAWIDAILPRTNSWSESMLVWGSERGDTASVCYDDNAKHKVEWMGFRVDVRQLSSAFVMDICTLAGRLGCLLLTRDCHVVAPDAVGILGAGNNSTAKNYLQDPASTLGGLKRTAAEIIRFPVKKNGDGAPPGSK